MCLDTKYRDLKHPFNGYGYKIYKSKDVDGYRFMKGGQYKSNVWHNAYYLPGDTPIQAGDFQLYVPGFHIFTNLKATLKKATQYTDCYIVRVQYKEAHTSGRQWNSNCVVANRMRIVKRLYTRKNNKTRKGN